MVHKLNSKSNKTLLEGLRVAFVNTADNMQSREKEFTTAVTARVDNMQSNQKEFVTGVTAVTAVDAKVAYVLGNDIVELKAKM